MQRADGEGHGDPPGARAQRRRKRLAAVLLIALAALWPPIVNGGPFYMSDTPSYIRAADSGAFKLLGVRTAWTEEYLRLYEQAPAAEAGATAAGAVDPDRERPVTLKGRSVYYGALLYGAHVAGSFWLVVIVQSLLAAVCIYLTLAALRRAAGKEPRPQDALLIGVAIALITPLGYFTGYLMPDVFGGFALLAVANLLFLWGQSSPRVRWFWLVLLLYSLLAHGVNLMLVMILAGGGLLYMLWRKTPLQRPQWIGIGACIVATFAGQAAFDRTVEALAGEAPVRPPFVAMRLIADGPGHEYLKRHCGRESYIYCRVAGQPNLHSDVLLWSKDPKRSLFRGLPPEEQRMSAAQERQFMLAVAADQPVGVARTALLNGVGQLLSFDLSPFNYSGENRQRFADTIPEDLFASVRRTRAFANTMPERWMETLSMLAVLASLIVIGSFLYRWRDEEALRPIMHVCMLLLAGIALNAALCGALSGPKGRYEMRLIWVLPLVAGGILTLGLHRRAALSASRRAPSGPLPES